ncbi:protein-glutamine gamma-glutamyltransferase E-like [Lacerta agilis]|uniref:protein-glutamine gamma-glutamyltransferase E-like n=1 Tax=Lacerta agilis TaxID=80427 RepID=UPI001419E0C6|nr:protein-glutamine gamma-glutamyltransferase E-like [Lacerta agilis]
MSDVPKIDWKRKANGSAHHTEQYPGTELVVRRGQPFSISLAFGGAAPAPGSLTFTVETGSTSALHDKTRVAFGISSAAPGGGSWGAVQDSPAASNSLSVAISSPASAAIGRYRLGIKTKAGASHLGTFVLLFNPWATGDDVFMGNDAERKEYVLSEFGIIFTGYAYHISNLPWDFGQFQEEVLDICLDILDRSLKYRQDPTADVRRRNDPKYIGRVLSAMVNSNDDRGVLEGKWIGDYSGGENPTSWNGSVDILRKWKHAGFRPVRYGQCWVYAGVLNTVLRCLGIPARVITNFESAHDTDGNLIVDVYYDSSGNHRASESIWNFHVWNEAWFARPDLGSKYNGWQILDATPQERSTGVYQCGPASLTAIKEGDVDLNYDCPFVYAEVNADCVTWRYDEDTGKSKKVHTKTKKVGQNTSTKAVGSYARQDVTINYKYPEGSEKERAVFKKACEKLNLNAFNAISAKGPDAVNPNLSGTLKSKSPEPKVGQDVDLVFTLKNLASEARSLTAKMTAWSIVYNGKPIHEVWKDSLAVTLGPQEEKEFPLKISYAEYQQRLTPDNMIRATALCQLSEGSEAVVEGNIMLSNPSVTLKVLGQAKVDQPLKVEVVFANPLNEEVKDCVLQAEGSDLLAEKIKLE